MKIYLSEFKASCISPNERLTMSVADVLLHKCKQLTKAALLMPGFLSTIACFM